MSPPLDILILGAGWTSTFLIPLLRTRHITFAATTRDGRSVAGEKTLKWSFDPQADSTSTEKNQFSSLPAAKTVLITFPLTGKGQSKKVVEEYSSAQSASGSSSSSSDIHFIQLGSTGIWQNSTALSSSTSPWVTRRSAYDTSNARAQAEDELLSLGGCVLNLAGLWGGERQARHWVDRVAKTKEEVKAKKSLHMVHGLDVARGVVAVSKDWRRAGGERWMLTDGFVYDWYSLFAGWADARTKEEEVNNGSGRDHDHREPSKQAQWVAELMREENVRALPRDVEALGRCYDSREFWETFRLTPLKARI